MKTRILLILLLVSSVGFAQTWNQVGATQFTDFASDGAMDFDNSGDPYIAYINPATNLVYVKKFNGTNWIDVGSTAISTTQGANVAITIRALDNQPIVAFRSTANNAMYAYRRNGTIWTPVINNVHTGEDLSNHRLQIQTNAAGDIRVAGRRTDQKLAIVQETIGGAQSTFLENLISTNNTYNGDHRYDFKDYDQYYLNWEDDFNGSRAGLKDVGAANTTWNYSITVNGATLKNISGIADENYLAVFNDVYNTAVDEVRVYGGITNVKSVPAANDIVKFRKSITDDKLYLMYADNATEDLVFENYNKNTGVWSAMPVIGLNSGISSFFVKMEMNPIDGNMYVMYLDGAKASVKKYEVPPAVNLPRMYVDANATGISDGSSWVNAYPNISSALNNLGTNTTELWVAAGTYTPDATNRGTSFTFSQDNLQIYGGFDGTETNLSDRNIALMHTTNETILSGDLTGNDDANITYNNATKSDNSLRIVQINANNISIDGVTIANGYADASSGEGRFGAALDTDDSVTLFTIKNSIIKDNVAWWAAGLMLASNMNPSTITIDACVFDNNLSSYAAAYYVLPRTNRTMNFNLTNSLFTNNKSDDNTTSRRGLGTPAGFIRAYYPGSVVNAKVINNTFANNQSLGSHPTSNFPVLGIGEVDGSFSLSIANNIFWGNTNYASTTSLAIAQAADDFPNNPFVYNSIDENNFSNITYKIDTSNTNPMFVDASNNDFTLQSGSPAINSGDNSKIPAGVTTDLLGNNRIHNTTVDMGPYEFGSTLDVQDFDFKNEFTIYPNPTTAVINIKMKASLKNAEIYNLQGQKIIGSKNKMINVSKLASGMYVLQIEDVNGITQAKRFIKH
jgi:hypothetical protein